VRSTRIIATDNDPNAEECIILIEILWSRALRQGAISYILEDIVAVSWLIYLPAIFFTGTRTALVGLVFTSILIFWHLRRHIRLSILVLSALFIYSMFFNI